MITYEYVQDIILPLFVFAAVSCATQAIVLCYVYILLVLISFCARRTSWGCVCGYSVGKTHTKR